VLHNYSPHHCNIFFTRKERGKVTTNLMSQQCILNMNREQTTFLGSNGAEL
jgi:hypothetical protein